MTDSNVVDLPNVDQGVRDDRALNVERGLVIVARWRRILATRRLAFLALIAGIAIWSWSVVDPNLWRLIAAAGFSAMVLLPTFVLYFLTHKAE